MTMDDYLSARPITSPFGLYDCDVPCDASIAVDRVGCVGRGRPPEAGDQDRRGRDPDHRACLLGPGHAHARAASARSVRAPLDEDDACNPSDVDVALVYDGFTFNAISWLEALGFCGIGEAKDWLDGGRRIALDGDLPVNPHGGQLSEGRTHGFGFFYEAMMQLRRRRRRAPGRRRADRRRHVGRRHPVRSAPPPPRLARSSDPSFELA